MTWESQLSFNCYIDINSLNYREYEHLSFHGSKIYNHESSPVWTPTIVSCDSSQ